MKTTLNKILACHPCGLRLTSPLTGYQKLVASLGPIDKNEGFSLLKVLESNGLDDAIWCLRAVDKTPARIKKMVLFALDCAQTREPHNSKAAELNAVTRSYIENTISLEEFREKCSYSYASYIAYDAASYIAYNAAYNAAYDAAYIAYNAAYIAYNAEENTKLFVALCEE